MLARTITKRAGTISEVHAWINYSQHSGGLFTIVQLTLVERNAGFSFITLHFGLQIWKSDSSIACQYDQLVQLVLM